MGVLRYVHHLFVPQSSNNHRAKLLHIDALSICLIVFLLVNIGLKSVHRHFPDVLGYATDIYVQSLLNKTNEYRTNANLDPLVLNDTLSKAAMLKAQNMFSENYWAHNSPSGKTPWVFITQAGYQYSVAGENLAKNFMSSDGVVDAWMVSPSHKDNILKPNYRDVGFAIVNGVLNGEETTLVVQMFGTQAYSPPKQAKTEPVEEGASTNEPIAIEQTHVEQVRIQGVSIKPKYDIHLVVRVVSYTFISIMMVAIGIDAIVASKRRIVRVAGHNMSHILFFGVLLILSVLTTSGSIL